MSYEDVWKSVEVGASASDVVVVGGPTIVTAISAPTADAILKDGNVTIWVQPSGTSQKLSIQVGSSLVIDNDNTACYVAYVGSTE